MEALAPRAKLRDAWHRFFFAQGSGRAEAYFRVGYASVLLIEQFGLSAKLELLFASSGVHPATPIDFLYPLWLVRVLFWLWVCAALLLALGVRTRLAAIGNLLLCVYFFGMRGFAAPHAADWLIHSSGFYLALMQSDARLSLDRRFSWVPRRTVWAWPRRLAQINWVSVYFTAGLAKLADDAWVSGHAFVDTLRHPLLTHYYPEFVVRIPNVMRVADWAIILWELAFPVLVAVRRLRGFALVSALVFNIGIFFTLRIGLFTLLASVGLLLFLEDTPAAGAARANGEPPATHKPASPKLWSRRFVVVHCCLIAVISLGHVLLGLGVQKLGLALTGLPIASYYMRGVAGFAYYDVWNSRFFLKPVRLIYYEATSPDGEPAAIEPFNHQGAFSPPLTYYTEEREGLLSIRLASMPVPANVWRSYFVYLIAKYRRDHSWPCPAQLRAYRIAESLDRFGAAPARLDVPKQRLVTVTPTCTGREIDMELEFAAPSTGQRVPAIRQNLDEITE